MPLPYNRKLNIGRQSEQFYNDTLHKNYEALKHIIDEPNENTGVPKKARVDGAIWYNKKENSLSAYHTSSQEWKPIFSNKFQIIDQITSKFPPQNPVLGQLWISNDVLLYFNGKEWQPIKASKDIDAQFDSSIFENFFMLSPLIQTGNKVVLDNATNLSRKKYVEELMKLNSINSISTSNEKWDLDHECDTVYDIDSGNFDTTIDNDNVLKRSTQLLVPNLLYNRVFLNGVLDKTKHRVESNICIEYPSDLLNRYTPSLLHLNPSRLHHIKKHFILIDKKIGIINFKYNHFELYGFRSGEIGGELLLPMSDSNSGYIKTEDGIILSNYQTQNYDYVLIIAYDFLYFKNTGKQIVTSNREISSSFYIENYQGPSNLFVNGIYLEPTEYTVNSIDKNISIKNASSADDLNGFASYASEFGYVKETDINNNALFKTINKYKNPLVFLNGIAISPSDGLNITKGQIFKVPNGKLNMIWSVMELSGIENNIEYSMVTNSTYGTVNNNNLITYNPKDILDTDNIILFVNGLLITSDDIEINRFNHTISANGVKRGQTYILLRDRYNKSFSNIAKQSAFYVGKFSESLVYFNGKLLCNSVAVNNIETSENIIPISGEIKTINNRDFLIRKSIIGDDGSPNLKLVSLDTIANSEQIKRDILNICYAYDNKNSSIVLNTNAFNNFNIRYNKDNDLISIYAFKYASFDGEPLIIGNIDIPSMYDILAQETELDIFINKYQYYETLNALIERKLKENKYTKDLINFRIPEYFTPNRNLLSVYINGIRQYYIEEHGDGHGFTLPERIEHATIISYVIESSDNDYEGYIKRKILNNKNVVPNTVNVYNLYPKGDKTTEDERISLYPGRVIVYVNGIRQRQDSFKVIDNNTIMFLDKKNVLIGNKNNYPEEIIKDSNGLPIVNDYTGEVETINWNHDDEILVEVRQDVYKIENNFKVTPYNDEILINIQNYGVNSNILESTDEVLIYINGIFTGLKNNDGTNIAYNKDISNKTLTISNPMIINILKTDELNNLLEINPELRDIYSNIYNKEYEYKSKDVILEWRDQ